MSEGIDISAICDVIMSTLKPFSGKCQNILIDTLASFRHQLYVKGSSAYLHLSKLIDQLERQEPGKTNSRGSKNGLLNSYF